MEHKQQKILITLKKRQLLIIGIYRSPVVSIGDLCSAVRETLNSISTQFNVFMGDFSVNWLNDSQSTPLYNFFIRDNAYSQLVTGSTTDSNTCIDHNSFNGILQLVEIRNSINDMKIYSF